MKKILVIVALVLMLSGGAFANELVGKKVYCKISDNFSVSFEFGKYKVKYIPVGNESSLVQGFKVYKSEYSYNLERIAIQDSPYFFYINRKTLKLTNFGNGKQCELVKRNVNLKKKMKKMFDKFYKEATSENKI